MPPKRKAEPAQDVDTPAQKKLNGPASNLIPVGDRQKAVKGEVNVDMLRMLCIDRQTGKKKELHFKKLVHAEIDWNDNDHIAKINSWRNQLYGRAGLKAKAVIMWVAEEEQYLELYFHLIIVQGSKHGLMIPRAKDVLEDFNNFFAGKVFTNSAGEPYAPRAPRAHNAFVSKMNRVVLNLKTRLEYMMLGKSGDYYRPVITEAMLDKYIELRQELVNSGVCGGGNTDKVFSWKVDHEKDDSWADNEHWKKFYQGVCNLEELVEKEAEDLDAELEEAVDELHFDKYYSLVKVEEVSDDEGMLLDSPVQGSEQTDSDVESGDDSANDSTFVEGETSITEPDTTAQETVVNKADTPEDGSPMTTDAQKANKADSPQVQDCDQTQKTAQTKDAVQIEVAAFTKAAINTETEGESTHTVHVATDTDIIMAESDLQPAADALLALSHTSNASNAL
ncbi:hypothetical protein K458DRAFT_397671 [Lentithecium fluviatile CBS 122367]|uniref:Uncharacterized protein n=1 Tax=Lentithecium fluviatile CBS 122367 TaxID=1168545 RepID=A0A6G1IBX9_9PLEO|nr:hypothetical protein K458DRAFT_397671 [Lentithecium fluviatile CBS 122367]